MKKISEISKLVGVSKRALQFYDDEGVIKAERSENNYRLYDRRVLENLWELMIYKEIGLELKEIKQMLSMPESRKKEYLGMQIKKIEEKVNELEGQIKFASFIMIYGLPEMPEESSGVTYTSRIEVLRKGGIYEAYKL